jgi:hypothetical protein
MNHLVATRDVPDEQDYENGVKNSCSRRRLGVEIKKSVNETNDIAANENTPAAVVREVAIEDCYKPEREHVCEWPHSGRS